MRQIRNEGMMAWGLDRNLRFRMLPCTMVGMIDFGLEEDQDCRAEMVYELEPSVVVVDCLRSFSARGKIKAEDRREVMAFLSNLARE